MTQLRIVPSVLLVSLLVSSLVPFVLAPAPAAAQQELPILPIDQVERGQKGYGLSVFSGTEPERFEVEVLGVVHNDNPGSSFILARLTGGPADQPLDRTGVIRGMSGSPVFIDDKMVGAVAFSWAFVEGAVAGITPIEEMRRLHNLPRPAPGPVLNAAGAPPVPLDRLLAGDLPSDLLQRQLAALAPPAVFGQPTSLQWSASGFGEQSRRLLETTLGGIAPMGTTPGTTAGSTIAGSTTVGAALSAAGLPMGAAAAGATSGSEPAPPDPQPGDAIALVLVDGDFRLGPAGTITDRTGDALVAFGHPFLGSGPVRVPMAEAEIVTVVPSQSNSFKVANVGRRMGAIEQDRDAGIEGRLGVEAPMIPVVVRVHGGQASEAGPVDGSGVGTGGSERDAEFHVQIAEIPQLSAGLMTLATFNALDVTRHAAGLQGLDLAVRFKLARYGDLELHQSFDGANAAGEMVGFLVSTAGYLLQNELEQVEIEEAEIDLTQYAKPRIATVVGAHAERSVVRPGQEVTLNLDLLPYRGEPFRRSVRVRIPEDVPDGRYFFFVGDAASIDGARMTLEPSEPVRLSQALRLIRSLHSRHEIGVLGFFSAHGLAVAGEVMPRLPGSMASIWSAAPSGSAKPLRLVVAQEIYQPVDRPLDGLVRIDLQVRRHEPVIGGTPMGEEPTAGDGGDDGEPAAGETSDGGKPEGGARQGGASKSGRSKSGESKRGSGDPSEKEERP